MYRADVVTAAFAAEEIPFRGEQPYLVRLLDMSHIDFEQLLMRHGFIVTGMDHQVFDGSIERVYSVEPSAEHLLFHALGIR
jgi:hypothetical protein